MTLFRRISNMRKQREATGADREGREARLCSLCFLMLNSVALSVPENHVTHCDWGKLQSHRVALPPRPAIMDVKRPEFNRSTQRKKRTRDLRRVLLLNSAVAILEVASG